MKLAELLIERAECIKKISELKNRIFANIKIQEGVLPSQDPNKLLTEVKKVNERLCEIIIAINNANHKTVLANKTTIADAIAMRDSFKSQRDILQSVIQMANMTDYRTTKAEIRMLVTVSISELQKQSDALAKQHRELDTKIQEKNWMTEV